MKKLLAIIFILLLIILGIFIYRKNINDGNVNVSEIEQIEQYIKKIYLWPEVTDEALPTFDSINNAPELWIWEVVKRDFEKYELDYDEIQDKANEIFGKQFTKQFPKEGSDYIYYSEENGKYLTSGIGLDTEDDLFLIKDIKKSSKGYEVEIVEYRIDYEEEMMENSEETEYDVYIKNTDEDIIATIKNTEVESKSINIVKENIDKFSIKKVNLIKDGEKVYVESVQDMST